MVTHSLHDKKRLKDLHTDCVRHELERLSDDFTGSMGFEYNLKDGGVRNLIVTMRKSIKIELT